MKPQPGEDQHDDGNGEAEDEPRAEVDHFCVWITTGKTKTARQFRMSARVCDGLRSGCYLWTHFTQCNLQITYAGKRMAGVDGICVMLTCDILINAIHSLWSLNLANTVCFDKNGTLSEFSTTPTAYLDPALHPCVCVDWQLLSVPSPYLCSRNSTLIRVSVWASHSVP